MTATLVKSLAFIVVTLLATGVLAATITNSSGGDNREFKAMFVDATSLNKGDDVRIAGVRVGTVQDIEVAQRRLAEVTFTVADSVPVTNGTSAQLRFRNLVGQRYISLDLPAKQGTRLPAGYTFSVEETQPALDLTLLFNGFQPLFKLLDPKDVNKLSAQIIAVFQGEGATVEGLLDSTASLTTTLAQKDQVIGQLITNLNSLLTTVNSRTDQLDTTIVTLQRLVSGLAGDREAIGSTLDGLGNLTVSVSRLLEQGRAPLKKSIDSLGDLSTNLARNGPTLDQFFQRLPAKLDQIGRTGSYGSWLNFYACSIEGRIPMPEGYFGELGMKPVAGRCR